jgi:endonuclease YncB( thermonuclease family)
MLACTSRPRLAALFLLSALAFPGPCRTAQAVAPSTRAATLAAPEFRASEWVELEKVVDGDTLHVRRAGKTAKLRLLCVDTEERFHPGQPSSAGKPQTVFGEQTALWAESFFAGLARGGQPVRLGLCFPGGHEQHDVYGRLLCHVVLPDGHDYELELVRSGRSPYFNKYGNSEIAHAAFAAAQAEAQRQKLGIWNPETNQPKTPGVPAAKRPYARLLPWWNARAEAVDGFRKRRAAPEPGLADGADYDALEGLLGQQVELFGELEGQPREWQGALELELYGQRRDRHVRLVVPESARAALAPAKLEQLAREYRQNYFYASGKVERGERGLELRLERPEQIRRAGPEPAAR